MKTEVLDAGSIAGYDEEVDVLVVGLGCAGAATALGAVEAGAETLVVERAGGGGGTSAMSGGVIYLGGGTALQKACGFEDSPEEMLKYLQASIGPGRDDAKLELYCDGTVEHFDWLVAQGIPYKQTFYYGQSGEPPTDDGLVWSGSENVYPFRDIARPAPRGHVAAVPGAAGHKVMSVLCEAVEASSARTRFNTVCSALYPRTRRLDQRRPCRDLRREPQHPGTGRRRHHDGRLRAERRRCSWRIGPRHGNARCASRPTATTALESGSGWRRAPARAISTRSPSRCR